MNQQNEEPARQDQSWVGELFCNLETSLEIYTESTPEPPKSVRIGDSSALWARHLFRGQRFAEPPAASACGFSATGS